MREVVRLGPVTNPGRGGGKQPVSPLQVGRVKLVDCLVDNVKMTMMFSGDKILTVDLTDGGYSGPEAMQLNGPDGSIVIWS